MKKIFTLRNIALITIGFSGMAALMYEVVWARMLSLIFGSTVYGVATMLSAFMAGLALGSFSMAKRVDRIKDLPRIFGLLLLGIGIYGVVFLFGLDYLQYPYFFFYKIFHQTFWLFLSAQFLLYFLVLLIPTAMMGAIFPVAVKIFSSDSQEVGKDAGYIYAANSLGSVAGPMLAGFILIPALGVTKTAMVAAGINMIFGAALLLFSDLKKDVKFMAVFLAALLVLGWSTFPPANLLNLFYAGEYRDLENFKEETANATPIFYKEGPYATVAVIKTVGGYLGLKSDGRGESSTLFEDMRNHSLLGYVPMFLHPNPKKVLNIGLGTGVTLGALSEFRDAEELHAIEVEPAIIEVAKGVFSPYNNDVMKDSRVVIHQTDGRNQLLMDKATYDVITSEVSHPISAGTGHLFTREFFELAYSRLNEGGIFLQWIPGHRLSLTEHKRITATFLSVFPDTEIWIDNADEAKNPTGANIETYLIGFKGVKPSEEEIRSRLAVNPTIANKLETFGMHTAEDFLALKILDEKGAARYALGVDYLNTDDFPRTEFAVLKSVLRSDFVKVADILNSIL